MSPDSQIIKKINSGDTEAFRELVLKHQDMLIGVLTRLLNDQLAAEEVAQDAFVKAFTALPGFRSEAKFSTWLMQIGINLARDRMRSNQRWERKGIISLDAIRQQENNRWEPSDTRAAANPLRDLSQRQEWQLLLKALETLSPEFREVFTLRHFEGLDYSEIAELTGKTPGSLKVKAHRARNQLRHKLEDLGVFADGSSSNVPTAPPLAGET